MKIETSNSLLQALRFHTNECHQAVQEKFDVFQRIQDINTYENLLLRFYYFYSEIEPQLALWDSQFRRLELDFELRRKVPNLLADICALGLTEPLTSQSNDKIASVPELRTLAQAVGCLYVLEGSTLGAQVICQHLRAIFESERATVPMAFYEGYGPKTGRMWREFCEFLLRYSHEIKTPQEQEQVLASGRQTFEILGKWLE